jgi:hypothetical protein
MNWNTQPSHGIANHYPNRDRYRDRNRFTLQFDIDTDTDTDSDSDFDELWNHSEKKRTRRPESYRVLFLWNPVQRRPYRFSRSPSTSQS